MTQADQIAKASLVGDGATVLLPFAFPFLNNEDVKVFELTIATNLEVELTTGFVTTGEGTGTGLVTFSVAPIIGVTVTAIRQVPFAQEADYRKDEGFPSAEHEDQMDEQVRMMQEVRESISRSIVIPVSTASAFNSTLNAVPVAKKGLRVSDDGLSWAFTSVDLNDIAVATTASAASAAAALVSENNAATSETNAATSAAAALAASLLIKTKDITWARASATTIVADIDGQFRGVATNTLFKFAANKTFDITTSGVAGGLDSGSEATSTMYYLLGIGDTTAVNAPHVLAVKESEYAAFVVGGLPSGYDDFKRIGFFFNNGAGDIDSGSFRDGLMTYTALIDTITASTTSTTFATMDLSSRLPDIARKVTSQLDHSATSTSEWRLTGAVSGIQVQTADPAGSHTLDLILDASQIFEAKVSAGTLTARVSAVYDDLEEEGQ